MLPLPLTEVNEFYVLATPAGWLSVSGFIEDILEVPFINSYVV